MLSMGREQYNPHDEHLRFGWKIVRYGVQSVLDDDAKLTLVLSWIDRTRPKFSGPSYLDDWRQLLERPDPLTLETIQKTRDFFDLPEERRGWWRGLVQSQPFTTIIPGKTADERRAVVSRHS